MAAEGLGGGLTVFVKRVCGHVPHRKFLQTFSSGHSRCCCATPIASGPIICCKVTFQNVYNSRYYYGTYFEQLSLHFRETTHGERKWPGPRLVGFRLTRYLVKPLLEMAPLRIRYSKGTTNIDVDLDAGTVLDLQQAILKATQILPSQQEGESCFIFYIGTKYGTEMIR